MPSGLKGYRALGLRYMPTLENAKRIRNVLVESGSPQEVIDAYFEPASNPANISAYRLVRILSGYLNTFQQCLIGAGIKCQPTHLMMLTPGQPDKIRVFQTLKLDKTDNGTLMSAGAFTYPGVLDTLVKQINLDMKNPAKAKGWEMLSRARNRLKKYEDISVDRALLHFTTARDRYSEADVKKIASNIVDSRMPVQIMYAKSAAEIYDMYHSGPKSCMTVGGENPERHWNGIKFDNFHPCMFFHYHPYTRGAYIKRADGTVRARTWLYTQNGKEYYGRLYGSLGTDTQALKSSLEELGINAIPNDHGSNPKGSGHYWQDAEFTIPGIPHRGEYVMPFPYLDNLKGAMQIKFDKGTNFFNIKTYSYRAAIKEVSFAGYETVQTGFISSSQVTSCYCGHCGNPVNTQTSPGQYLDNDTGERYCSNRCLDKVGKIMAMDGMGSYRIVLKDDAVIDPLVETWHTNHQAIIDLGGYMYVSDITFMPEQEEYTRGGNNIGRLGLAFRQDSHRCAYESSGIKNFKGVLDKSYVKKQQQVEINFDTVSGVKLSGEFRDAFLGDVINADPKYGYPTCKALDVDYNEGTPVIRDLLGSRYYFNELVKADQEVA